MRTYFQIIQFTQKFLLAVSIILMLTLPLILVFLPNLIPANATGRFYDISHIALFFVMTVRPLADIFTKTKFIRPLVILRKGAGVFSAAIILSFIFSKIIMDPSGYLMAFGTVKYWSLTNYALLAHIADISAIFLIITSNNFSKRILGSWWKIIQKLSYPYFYASSFYVFFISGENIMLLSMFIVTALTMIAYVMNQKKASVQPPTAIPQKPITTTEITTQTV